MRPTEATMATTTSCCRQYAVGHSLYVYTASEWTWCGGVSPKCV